MLALLICDNTGTFDSFGRLTGMYQPQAVKHVIIPKPNGGERKLGIPRVYGQADSDAHIALYTDTSIHCRDEFIDIV